MVNIVRAIEVFARQNSEFPECLDSGYNYNYSRPFSDYCNGRQICDISAAFLDENKLFEAETYILPDNSYYLKPFRIDIIYQCISK